MFRLEERQLHILMFLVLGASVILFCLLGIEKIAPLDERGGIQGMTDFSDGWICVYETDDMERLEEYHNSQEGDFDEGDRIVQEVTALPATIPVVESTPLAIFHRVPEIRQETQYLLLETRKTAVEVSIEDKIIYRSSGKENGITAYHLVPLVQEYKDEILRIKFSGQPKGKMQIYAIYIGTRNQLWVQLLSESGITPVLGCIFVGISLCMLLICTIMNNTWQQKRLLLYSGLEGLALGLLFLLEGRLAVILSGWNYGIGLLRTCFIIMIGILHLMVMRCFMYRKKVLAAVDTGILVYGVFYISVMVLQAFSIVQFDMAYAIGKWMFAVCSLIYVVVLGVAMHRYGQKECTLPFTANIILLLGVGVQLVSQLLRVQQSSGNMWYLLAGLVLYILFMWFVGLRQALRVIQKEEKNPYDEKALRAEAVERLNPNLIFAALHSLQNLIKNGSDNSVKMLYYISVYIRNNFIALEKAGEMISFEEELEHMIAYLQIQKIRNVNLGVNFECKVKEFQVPRHTLEPMVENAVKYGVSGKDNKGNIAIRTYMRAEGYAVQIIDDGIGFDKQLLKRHSSTALLNLLDVLEETCQAQTEIISKEGKGTVITIVFPMLENEVMDILEEMEM